MILLGRVCSLMLILATVLILWYTVMNTGSLFIVILVMTSVVAVLGVFSALIFEAASAKDNNE